jgi:hypothetical protein
MVRWLAAGCLKIETLLLYNETIYNETTLLQSKIFLSPPRPGGRGNARH